MLDRLIEVHYKPNLIQYIYLFRKGFDKLINGEHCQSYC